MLYPSASRALVEDDDRFFRLAQLLSGERPPSGARDLTALAYYRWLIDT